MMYSLGHHSPLKTTQPYPLALLVQKCSSERKNYHPSIIQYLLVNTCVLKIEQNYNVYHNDPFLFPFVTSFMYIFSTSISRHCMVEAFMQVATALRSLGSKGSAPNHRWKPWMFWRWVCPKIAKIGVPWVQSNLVFGTWWLFWTYRLTPFWDKRIYFEV